MARLLEAKGMAGSQLMSMVKAHHARIEAAVQAAVDAHAEHQEAVGEGEGTASKGERKTGRGAAGEGRGPGTKDRGRGRRRSRSPRTTAWPEKTLFRKMTKLRI